jgi:phenol 2-monooxygenase
MAACWASQFGEGMSTRIIDLKSARTATGHADGINSRTLEIFDSFGIVDPIVRRGVHEVEMSYWVCFLLLVDFLFSISLREYRWMC